MKELYLEELERYLVTMTQPERTALLKRYDGLLDKLQEKGESPYEILGTPKELAERIIFGGETLPPPLPKKKHHWGWWIAAACLGAVVMTGVGLGMVGKAVFWDKSSHRFRFASDTRVIEMEKTKVDAFESLDFDLNMADVELIPSDDYYVEYRLKTAVSEPVKNKNKKLVISDSEDYIFNFNFNFGKNESSGRTYVKIYYPEDAKFRDVDIDLDMGRLDMDGLHADDFLADLDMGALDMRACMLKDAQMSLDMGGLDVRDSQFEDLEIDLDMGSLDMDDCSVSRRLQGDLDMGSANIKLLDKDEDGKKLEYGYKLDTDMSSIEVNGASCGKEYDKSGDVKIDVSCDMGSITIKE